MPLARIVTRFPETAVSLADYLAHRGYTVEMATPEQAHASPAELEITVETCAAEEARERAAQLASRLGVDVVVAPGAILGKAATTVEYPAELQSEKLVEERQPLRESLAVRSQVVRETLDEWRRGSHSAMVAASDRGKIVTRRLAEGLKQLVHRLSVKGSILAARSLRTAGQWAQQFSRLAREYVSKAAATGQATIRQGRARIREARLQAEQRSRVRAAMQVRRQETQRQQILAQERVEEQKRAQQAVDQTARLREQEEQARQQAILLNQQQVEVHIPQKLGGQDQDDEVESGITSVPAPIAPLRRPPPPRSSLVAYTRNRDWKMAFMGAAAASILIMGVSFGFMNAAPPNHDMEQKLPFGATAVQPSPPALIVPALDRKPEVVQPEVTAEAAKPVVNVEPITTMASHAEPGDDEYLDDEVVIRHFPSESALKSRTGEDGVKRISDVE